MCGIIGAMTLHSRGFSTDEVQALRSGLFMSTVRGIDGTGIVGIPDEVAVNKDGTASKKCITIHKEALPPQAGLSKGQFAALLHNQRAAIMHVRAATVGSLSDAACHPFEHGPVVGVHNGTLHDYKTAFRRWDGGNYKPVSDSDVLYYALGNADPDDAVDVLAATSGAYALVWYDARLHALRMARNYARPLVMLKEKDTWWWASEAGFLTASISRISRLTDKPFHQLRPWKLETGKILTIPLNGNEATVADIPERTYPRSGGGSRGFWDDWDDFDKRYNSTSMNGVYETGEITLLKERAEARGANHRVLSISEDLKTLPGGTNVAAAVSECIVDTFDGWPLGNTINETEQELSKVLMPLMLAGSSKKLTANGKPVMNVAFGHVVLGDNRPVFAVCSIPNALYEHIRKSRRVWMNRGYSPDERPLFTIPCIPKRIIAYSTGQIAVSAMFDSSAKDEVEEIDEGQFKASVNIAYKYTSHYSNPHYVMLTGSTPLSWPKAWAPEPEEGGK